MPENLICPACNLRVGGVVARKPEGSLVICGTCGTVLLLPPVGCLVIATEYHKEALFGDAVIGGVMRAVVRRIKARYC